MADSQPMVQWRYLEEGMHNHRVKYRVWQLALQLRSLSSCYSTHTSEYEIYFCLLSPCNLSVMSRLSCLPILPNATSSKLWPCRLYRPPASTNAGQGLYALMGNHPNPGTEPSPPRILPSPLHPPTFSSLPHAWHAVDDTDRPLGCEVDTSAWPSSSPTALPCHPTPLRHRQNEFWLQWQRQFHDTVVGRLHHIITARSYPLKTSRDGTNICFFIGTKVNPNAWNVFPAFFMHLSKEGPKIQ